MHERNPHRLSKFVVVSLALHGLVLVVSDLASLFFRADQRISIRNAPASIEVAAKEKQEELLAKEELDSESIQIIVVRRPKRPREQPQAKSEGAKWDEKPALVANPAPPYPAVAYRMGWEGTTEIQLTLSTEGIPTDAVVVRSSGYAALDRSALDTVRSWRFTPAQLLGTPVRSTVVVPVAFRLVDTQS